MPMPISLWGRYSGRVLPWGELNASLAAAGEKSSQFRAASAFSASMGMVLLHLPLPEKMPEHMVSRAQVEQRSMPGKFSPAAVHYILLIRKARTGLSRGNKFSVRLMRRNST